MKYMAIWLHVRPKAWTPEPEAMDFIIYGGNCMEIIMMDLVFLYHMGVKKIFQGIIHFYYIAVLALP